MIQHFKRVLNHPDKAYNFAARKVKEALFWNHYYNAIREPKVRSAIPDGPELHNEILKEFKKSGIEAVDFEIDISDYRQYIDKAQYHKFPAYYGGGKAKNFFEKTLEHYLAAKLLNLSKEDIYIDIASNNSPMPEIYQKLYGCNAYKQDLILPKGINGREIGGDAGNMPVKDGFATKMALHDALQCFENNSDIGFIKEASRVLRKGGKLCILPLYLFTRYAVQTDPAAMPKGGIDFESNVMLYCIKGFGCRFNRIYDVPHFIARIINNLNTLKFTLYVVRNEKEVDPSCYVKLIGLFEKE
ncbi:MAG: hypothetical protein JOZ78_16440 [Chroococcidiopsidaceae cyanobacterium CP_BM_ER_R8_30]|nr:hypothetical protein [Chroococcidiopsidaceae cyanobacterium CP_BM_ER_R8_30]